MGIKGYAPVNDDDLVLDGTGNPVLGNPFTITILDPTATDRVPISEDLPKNITITRVSHQTDTGTVDWRIYSGANPMTATTNSVFASDEQSTSTKQNETSFSAANHDATDGLVYVATAVASSPTVLTITIHWVPNNA